MQSSSNPPQPQPPRRYSRVQGSYAPAYQTARPQATGRTMPPADFGTVPAPQPIIRAPRVLNKRHDGVPPGAIYVGRPSPFGNPFKLPDVHSDIQRAEVIAKFEAYLLSNPSLLARVKAELRGHDRLLVCTVALSRRYPSQVCEFLTDFATPQGQSHFRLYTACPSHLADSLLDDRNHLVGPASADDPDAPEEYSSVGPRDLPTHLRMSSSPSPLLLRRQFPSLFLIAAPHAPRPPLPTVEQAQAAMQAMNDVAIRARPVRIDFVSGPSALSAPSASPAKIAPTARRTARRR
ncbi:hypothetical protein PAPYR_9753 [Paratrimastix pyriformis]|uniref:DUF4326 domain-containing protein n=1 Tax=Paratrimastix pyriformis TaxID=342808 RepID=A0ABQ8U7G8_9EUKA|nr:hypothetical protein PAPYR_9753 [Paratrimastix pyriformis]